MGLQKIPKSLLAAPILFLVAGLIVFLYLDQNQAYHSPLFGTSLASSPRDQALLDLQQRAEEMAEQVRKRAELLADLNTEKMVELGKEIVHGRGLCFNCHSIGEVGGGTQGPDLQGIGSRAGSRVSGMSDIEYLAQSLYDPNAYVVEGFAPSMIPADKPPIGLSEVEIMMVIAYLQSLGGTPTITPETKLP